jgi:hypothetical protein
MVLVLFQTDEGESSVWFVSLQAFQEWFWSHTNILVKKVMA